MYLRMRQSARSSRTAKSSSQLWAMPARSPYRRTRAGIGEDAVSAVIHKAAIYMPFAELVDIEKEIERLKKEEERLTKELARSNGMLNNEKFHQQSAPGQDR